MKIKIEFGTEYISSIREMKFVSSGQWSTDGSLIHRDYTIAKCIRYYMEFFDCRGIYILDGELL